MTKTKLLTYLGREALWKPQSRARGASIAVRVLITHVKQRYGRDEARITPHSGTGMTWVSADSLRLLPQRSQNLY